MFDLKLSPDFSRKRKELLAQTAVPPVWLPRGVELCLESISKPERRGSPEPNSVLALWLDCVRAMRPMLIQAAGIALLASFCAALASLAAMQILKTRHGLEALLLYSLAYFSMNCLSQLAILASGRLRAWVSMGAESHLVGLISGKLVRMSSLSAARQSSGNLKTLITSDVHNIGQFMDNLVRNLIPAVIALAVISPLLVRFAGKAGLLGLVGMALILPISLGLNRISTYFQDQSQSRMDELTSLAGEWVKNIRLIRYLSWDGAMRREVAEKVRGFMNVSIGQHFMACLIYGLSTTWWMVSTAFVLLAAWWLREPLDIVSFFGSLWLLTFLSNYFTHLPNTIRLYGMAAPSMKRIARLLGEQEQADFLVPSLSQEELAEPVRVRFDRVSFEYPGGRKAIRELSCEIDLSQRLAIIGEIGSGKTTFLKLLCGELPPTSGRIVVEFRQGGAADLWSRGAYESFRRALAYVPQEPFVSSDRISSNITLGAPANERDVCEAAYWAELEADLAALPRGISEEIGESGVNLSGGQRQRLNLARAFFSGRGYLVLDDTLSAVDTRTEVLLMDRLLSPGERSGRAGGFALVTHRTGELMRVDRILVLREGQVIEQGTPAELSADPDSQYLRVLRAYEAIPGAADG